MATQKKVAPKKTLAPATKAPVQAAKAVMKASVEAAVKPPVNTSARTSTKVPAKAVAKAAGPVKATTCHPIGMDAYSAAREGLWDVKLQMAAKALEKRGFATSIVPTAQDAAILVLKKLLPESKAKSVAFGGSMTIIQSGLFDALKKASGLNVIDTYDTSIGMPALIERRRQVMAVDFYLCSANAVTMDGTVMLVDGIGNRSASVQFGPLHVVLLVGRNKLCETIDAGFARVKNISAPANAIRLSRNTPCTKTGRCMDCDSPERVCSVWALVTRCFPARRIHVVLIDEDLGF